MNPTFYKITVCQIITLFGNAALRFALPLYLLRRIDSAALYGSVTALALVPMLLGTLAGGVLADRCRKQKIMAMLDTVSAIGMAAAAAAMPGSGSVHCQFRMRPPHVHACVCHPKRFSARQGRCSGWPWCWPCSIWLSCPRLLSVCSC